MRNMDSSTAPAARSTRGIRPTLDGSGLCGSRRTLVLEQNPELSVPVLPPVREAAEWARVASSRPFGVTRHEGCHRDVVAGACRFQ